MQTDLSHVPIGESAIVLGFSDEEISLKLIELGCIPGTKITMVRKAPLGDPLAFACLGSLISLRIQEATTVQVDCL
jgi:ferrous iron transport protein A